MYPLVSRSLPKEHPLTTPTVPLPYLCPAGVSHRAMLYLKSSFCFLQSFTLVIFSFTATLMFLPSWRASVTDKGSSFLCSSACCYSDPASKRRGREGQVLDFSKQWASGVCFAKSTHNNQKDLLHLVKLFKNTENNSTPQWHAPTTVWVQILGSWSLTLLQHSICMY